MSHAITRSPTAVMQLLTREPTPEAAADAADECRRLLEYLEEPELRLIALLKVEGYTNEEIAARLDCVARTIERKVSRIRLLWKHELKDLEP
jgi:DNA-directed RNA polymerase specialized sigma24 family protein